MMSWFPIFAAGFLLGWWMCAATWPLSGRKPRDRDPDWRCSFNHENTNRPPSERPLEFRHRPIKEISFPAVEDLGVVVMDLRARIEALEARLLEREAQQ